MTASNRKILNDDASFAFMEDAPKRIQCSACGKRIAPEAPACPRCGAENDWFHPAIQDFYDADDDGEFDHMPLFDVTCEDGFLLEGKAFLRKTPLEYAPEFISVIVFRLFTWVMIGVLLLGAAVMKEAGLAIFFVEAFVVGCIFRDGWKASVSCK